MSSAYLRRSPGAAAAFACSSCWPSSTAPAHWHHDPRRRARPPPSLELSRRWRGAPVDSGCRRRPACCLACPTVPRERPYRKRHGRTLAPLPRVAARTGLAGTTPPASGCCSCTGCSGRAAARSLLSKPSEALPLLLSVFFVCCRRCSLSSYNRRNWKQETPLCYPSWLARRERAWNASISGNDVDGVNQKTREDYIGAKKEAPDWWTQT